MLLLLHTILLPLLLLLRWNNIAHGFPTSSSSFPCRRRHHHPHHHYVDGHNHDKRDSKLITATNRSCPNGWNGQIIRAYNAFASAPNNDDSSETTAKVTPSSSLTPLFFRVGVIGSGSIAYGTASLLSSLGHDPMIWSPSGASAPKPNGMTPTTTNVEDDAQMSPIETVSAGIQSTGAIEHNFNVRIAHSPDELVRCNDDVLIVALPANGHRGVFDTLSPVIVDHLLTRYADIEAMHNQHNEQHNIHSVRRTSMSTPPAMHIIISSHASLGAVYLLQSLKEECHKRQCTDVNVPNDIDILDGIRITAWGTTAVTARKTSDNSVRVLTVRQSVDYCTVPSSSSNSSLEEEDHTTITTTASTSTRRRRELLLRNHDGYELCTTLFGPRFTYRTGGLLAISLSNLNPQNHLGIVLGNMSRMDPPPPPPPLPTTTFPSLQAQSTSPSFPTWYQGQNITPNIGRLMEALDTERIEIAKSLGIDVRTIHEHFSWSFHVPMETLAEDVVDEEDTSITTMNDNDNDPSSSRPVVKPKMRPLTVSEMNQQMHHYLKNDVLGPTNPNSRYVLEDVPYGLVLTILLGKLTNKPAILHEAGIQILSAMYGRNFMDENDLLHGLGLLQIMGDDYNMIPSLDKWKRMANTGTFQDCESE